VGVAKSADFYVEVERAVATLTSLDLPPRCSIEVQRRPATAELLAIGARAVAARVRAERTNIVYE
jgi:hypothetical protein